MIVYVLLLGGGSNTLMDPCRSNIGGGPDPCDPCGVDAYVSVILLYECTVIA